MTNFQRLISYIYTYEGGIKGKNIGFAKLEVRGSQCRITVNVKKIFVGGNPIGVYMLTGREEIRIGTLFARNGSGEFRTVIHTQDLEHTGHSLDDCYGLSVHDVESNWRSYTTIWEDAVAHAAEVDLADVTAGRAARNASGNTQSESQNTPQSMPQSTSHNMSQDTSQNTDAVQVKAPSPEPRTAPLPISAEIERELEREELKQMGMPESEIHPKQTRTGNVVRLYGDGRSERLGALPELIPEPRIAKEEERAAAGISGFRENERAAQYEDMNLEPASEKPHEEESVTEAQAVRESVSGAQASQEGASGGQAVLREVSESGTALEHTSEAQAVREAVSGPQTAREAASEPGTAAEALEMPGIREAVEEMPGVPEAVEEMPGVSEAVEEMPGVPEAMTEAQNVQTGGMEAPQAVRQAAGPAQGVRESMPHETAVPEAATDNGARSHAAFAGTAGGPALGFLEESHPAMESEAVVSQSPQAVRQAGPALAQGGLRREIRNQVSMRPGAPLERVQKQEAAPALSAPPCPQTAEQKAPGTAPAQSGSVISFRERSDTQNEQEMWEMLRKRYPKILAFDYADGCEILTIKPQDIGLLPRETWVYGNNSFLLHGFYSFRYLILARLNNPNGRPRYLLGIPGHYYSNEKYMAAMFGFPDFVLSKNQPPKDGRFGYWYTDIKIGE